ncbi:MAG: single-stranded DNA-binding protein [Myxococcales bacterium]|nr:single-stranded DNA-binding protein [Myxococcales bacterium]
MAGLNKVMLIGNLGRDPELRYTQSGQAVANFTLATNENWKNKSGEREERTEWHRLVVWGRQAEVARDYLAKGRQIFVEGRIQTREWEDKEGQKRTTTEVVVNHFVMLGRKDGAEAGRESSGQEDPGPAGPPEPAGGSDDIPF